MLSLFAAVKIASKFPTCQRISFALLSQSFSEKSCPSFQPEFKYFKMKFATTSLVLLSSFVAAQSSSTTTTVQITTAQTATVSSTSISTPISTASSSVNPATSATTTTTSTTAAATATSTVSKSGALSQLGSSNVLLALVFTAAGAILV